MKTKIFTLFCCIQTLAGIAQNAPSIKVGNNKYENEKLPPFSEILTSNNKANYNAKIKRIDYETLNSIDYFRAIEEIEKKQKEINSLMVDIKKEKNNVDDAPLRIQKKTLEIEIDDLNKKKKIYWHNYVKEYIEYAPYTLGFWEARSNALYELIYTDNKDSAFKLLTNTGFNIGNNTGSVYSELVSGQMYIFRVSLGAMVASSSSNNEQEAIKQEAYQRLSTFGGNTVLSLEYPLLYAHTNNNQAIFLSRLIMKGTADFPQFGTKSENWAGSGSFQLDLYADVATSNNKIRFFANTNIGQYYGTKTFKTNLGLDNSTFNFGQAKVGITFNNISLSFIVATFSSQDILRNKNVIAGGQILPF